MGNNTQNFTSAATDVSEFITDLDGGMFERKLSVALSEVAAKVVDTDKSGDVQLKFRFTRIPGTTQVHVAHALKYVKPTEDGKLTEEESRTTALHVGKYGKLTLTPENQLSFLDKTGEPHAS